MCSSLLLPRTVKWDSFFLLLQRPPWVHLFAAQPRLATVVPCDTYNHWIVVDKVEALKHVEAAVPLVYDAATSSSHRQTVGFASSLPFSLVGICLHKPPSSLARPPMPATPEPLQTLTAAPSLLVPSSCQRKGFHCCTIVTLREHLRKLQAPNLAIVVAANGHHRFLHHHFRAHLFFPFSQSRVS